MQKIHGKKNTLRLSLIQSDILWEDPQTNRSRFENKIKLLADQTDLIILPEMFTTGFTMNTPQNSETMQGETVAWLTEMAASVSAHIAGSLIIQEDNKFFNRLVWAKPDGKLFHYDKRHLFRIAGEDKYFTAGSERLIITIYGWRILPLICYDLRFPVWARNNKNEFDLIIYSANWPERRIAHWDLLMQSRAVENQCYVAGVNRIGTDGQGINHPGHSAVYDFMGKPLNEISSSEFIITAELSHSTLTLYREKFPVWQDADTFKIK